MPHSSLPDYDDVIAELAALRIPISLAGGFDGVSEVGAANEDWNRRTRYRPFFQTDQTTKVAIPLDPPGPDQRTNLVGGSRLLQLPNGLLSCDSVVVDVDPINSPSGTPLVLGKDYWLGPTIAPTQVPAEPWTEIKFSYVQRGVPQSIVVTGVWGYCVDFIPDLAWTGMRDLATVRVLESYLQWLIAAGYTEAHELDAGRTIDPVKLNKVLCWMRGRAERGLNLFRLLT